MLADRLEHKEAKLSSLHRRRGLHEFVAFVQAHRVLAALYRIGWSLKRQSGSHKVLRGPGPPEFRLVRFTIARKSARECSRVSRSTGFEARRL